MEPARCRGGFGTVLEPDELLFAVMDEGECIAAATAWLGADKVVEVKLVGGRDYRRWLNALDEKIGAAAKDAGATSLVAFGRAGWARVLEGWAHRKIGDDMMFRRELA